MDYYNKYTSNRYCPCSSSGENYVFVQGNTGPQGLRESPDRKGSRAREREARKDLKDLKENKGVLAQLVLVGCRYSRTSRTSRSSR